jgi:lipopolysaccharide/colanic/teichoic acid biosynthesis glycosyltransferase
MNTLYATYFKPLLDSGLALIGILILSPLLLTIAIAIKLTSNGPTLYKQQRYGQNFRPFQVLKFRSMIINANQKGLLITAQNDPRITPIGKILRKTKCDELPQLINVLKGDMALVGPRPEVKKYIDHFKTDYEKILSIKPGITDNAAIAFINEEELLANKSEPEHTYIHDILPKKIELYHQYIRTISFKTDIKIIFKTLFKLGTK